jgi:uroporphyrinogen-III decarboxylase
MARSLYLDLAAKGVSMPIGADLVLHDHSDWQDIIKDGPRLGALLIEAAKRYKTPLAFPVMDLQLEKACLAAHFGVSAEAAPTWHLPEAPAEAEVARIVKALEQGEISPRMKAVAESVAFVKKQGTHTAVGMAIGPFSLMTKLMADPIVPVYQAGMGVSAADDEEVDLAEKALRLALACTLAHIRSQVKAGAQAIFIAEPAANKVYIDPTQVKGGSDVFERFVMKTNREIVKLLEASGVDLLFHCCGELVDDYLVEFTKLRPALLSLGSSRKLWEDARLVPKDIVLYGNLPTKHFYSDELVPLASVGVKARELREKMKGAAHPFILGSECDVLCVHGKEKALKEKVGALVDA